MQNFLLTLLICSVTMSVLALAYMAATPLLAKRYSSKGRYYAWLVIMVGLVIPFRPQFGNALVSVEVPSGAPSHFVPSIILPPIENAAVASGLNIPWWQVGFALWLAGLVVFIAYHGIKHYRFAKMARRWSVCITDSQILSLFHGIKSEMGVKRQIQIYFCKSVGSPMIIGLFKPRILLPTVELEKNELRFILQHELVHYKRKDLLYKYLVLMATAVHWFNPAVYLIAKTVNALCETSCDAEVLRGADMGTRQSYGEAIIGVVQYQSKMKTALSTSFYSGKAGINKRICAIMDATKKKTGMYIIFTIIFSIVSLGFVVAVRAEHFAPINEFDESSHCSLVGEVPWHVLEWPSMEWDEQTIDKMLEENTSSLERFGFIVFTSIFMIPGYDNPVSHKYFIINREFYRYGRDKIPLPNHVVSHVLNNWQWTG